MSRLPNPLIIVMLLVSCISARRFDYKTAYKFKFLEYTEPVVPEGTRSLTASSEKSFPALKTGI